MSRKRKKLKQHNKSCSIPTIQSVTREQKREAEMLATLAHLQKEIRKQLPLEVGGTPFLAAPPDDTICTSCGAGATAALYLERPETVHPHDDYVYLCSDCYSAAAWANHQSPSEVRDWLTDRRLLPVEECLKLLEGE